MARKSYFFLGSVTFGAAVFVSAWLVFASWIVTSIFAILFAIPAALIVGSSIWLSKTLFHVFSGYFSERYSSPRGKIGVNILFAAIIACSICSIPLTRHLLLRDGTEEGLRAFYASHHESFNRLAAHCSSKRDLSMSRTNGVWHIGPSRVAALSPTAYSLLSFLKNEEFEVKTGPVSIHVERWSRDHGVWECEHRGIVYSETPPDNLVEHFRNQENWERKDDTLYIRIEGSWYMYSQNILL